MSEDKRHALQHAANKLEVAASLERKIRAGEKLNGDEWEMRAGTSLQPDEMVLVADVIRKACYLDARGVEIDALHTEQKQAEARQWKAVTDYQQMVRRNPDKTVKSPHAARSLWRARSRNTNLAVELVNYYMDALDLTQNAAEREAAKALGRAQDNVRSQCAKARRKGIRRK